MSIDQRAFQGNPLSYFSKVINVFSGTMRDGADENNKLSLSLVFLKC